MPFPITGVQIMGFRGGNRGLYPQYMSNGGWEESLDTIVFVAFGNVALFRKIAQATHRPARNVI